MGVLTLFWFFLGLLAYSVVLIVCFRLLTRFLRSRSRTIYKFLAALGLIALECFVIWRIIFFLTAILSMIY